jgi:hypothetical protein
MPRTVPSQVVNLIDDVWEWAKNQPADPNKPMKIYFDHAGVLSGIVGMADTIPGELIVLSPRDGAKYAAALASIRHQLERWNAQGGNSTMDKLRGLDPRNPIAVLRECLAKCPDEPAAGAVAGFEFIKDDDLRGSLLNDLAAVSRALGSGEWKAATVLGGSLLEALLLWAATEHRNRDAKAFSLGVQKAIARELKTAPSEDLESWNLYQLIEICADCKLISQDSVTQARLTKGFRNLIHPGRAIRLSAETSIGTAMAARAAVDFVGRDLAKSLP